MKKNKTSNKKLKLDKETIRRVEQKELRDVAGWGPSNSCKFCGTVISCRPGC